MRRRAALFALLVSVLWTSAPAAELFSKSYVFKPGIVLETAVPVDEDLRLDWVYFKVPKPIEGRIRRTSGPVSVRVAVSNGASTPRRVAIALALFDDEDRLLGVTSGGSRLSAVRPGRQRTFTLVVDGVYGSVHRATTFQISLEPR